MKVEGPNRTQNTAKTKKSGKTSGSDASFKDLVTGAAEETAGAAATRSIAKVDALLSVQATEDPTERATRGRMRQRSEKVLGALDMLRDQMLSGTMTVGHMIDIADVISSHREKIQDPALTGLMDEIDLRAQVELAKMRKALDNA